MQKSEFNVWALVAVIRNNAQTLLSATDKRCPADSLQAYDYLCTVGEALKEFKDTFNELDKKIYAKVTTEAENDDK